MKRLSRSGRIAALLLAVLTTASCGDGITFPPDFASSLNIDLTAMTKTASGMYYQDLAVGTGDPAQAGDEATVTYSGWLPSGQLFDSGSFPFTLATGQVIPGFDEGVTGMRVGGKRKMVIPPDLAYGKQGKGSIPPNSTLIFEVDLTKLN